MKKASWIPRERLAALPVTHAWADDNPFHLIADPSKELEQQCMGLSFRAQAALVIACTEWLVARFEGVLSEPQLDEYLEALWAAVVDQRFVTFNGDLLSSDDGPVHGPIGVAIATATDMFRGCDHRDAAFAVALVRHVTGSDPGFEKWLEESLERLERRHPRGTDGVVAREIFGIDLAADEESRLVVRFLRQLDASKNRFLVPGWH